MDKKPAARKKTPTKKPPSSKKKSIEDDLVLRMNTMTVYQPFNFYCHFPYLVKHTPFIDGSKHVLVDILCLSQHQSMFRILVGSKGDTVEVRVEIPPLFYSSDRVNEEYNVTNTRDAVITSHQDVIDEIKNHHGFDEILSDPPMIVQLPFRVEQRISTRKLMWNRGDNKLYQEMFDAHGVTECTHQMMPILRVELVGVDKNIGDNNWTSTVLNGALTPPRQHGRQAYAPPAQPHPQQPPAYAQPQYYQQQGNAFYAQQQHGHFPAQPPPQQQQPAGPAFNYQPPPPQPHPFQAPPPQQPPPFQAPPPPPPQQQQQYANAHPAPDQQQEQARREAAERAQREAAEREAERTAQAQAAMREAAAQAAARAEREADEAQAQREAEEFRERVRRATRTEYHDAQQDAFHRNQPSPPW
jgi:hypothetical protein